MCVPGLLGSFNPALVLKGGSADIGRVNPGAINYRWLKLLFQGEQCFFCKSFYYSGGKMLGKRLETPERRNTEVFSNYCALIRILIVFVIALF